MNVLLFAGTTEGRRLAETMDAAQIDFTVSVATEYGSDLLPDLKYGKVLTGRMLIEDMSRIFPAYDVIVDATHPYATQVSENIREAARPQGIPVLRTCRPKSDTASCLHFQDASQAADWLFKTEGNIFLTTGSKELSSFSCLSRERLYVRVLPSVPSIELCEKAGILHSHIVAMQGPFDRRLETALLSHYRIRYLVTKDSGRAGGVEEKLAAARAMNVTALVICRPQDESGLSVPEIMKLIQTQFSGR